MAECIPGAASCVNVTDAPVNPAAATTTTAAVASSAVREPRRRLGGTCRLVRFGA